MEQTMIVVDDEDNVLGFAPRSECHTGNGKRHRAFVLLVYNKNKEILLQHRKHSLFDNLWDLTGASHPLRVDGRNEGYEESALHCLNREWGISDVKLRNVGAFNYFKEYKDRCENEHCAIIVGQYDGKFTANPEEAYGFRWVGIEQLISEVKAKPDEFTAWAVEAIKLLKNSSFRQLL
ncbi:MAG: NUDIX domain-containing protein [Candidatus Aenigmatarchaeota archaeon]